MNEESKIRTIEKNGGSYLKNYKPEHITYAMCLAAVNSEGSAIRYVPEKYRTEEIFQIAIKKDPDVLSIMPREYLTKEICEEAMKDGAGTLRLVPKDLRTQEVCLAAMHGYGENSERMKYIPPEVLTPQFFANVIKKCGPKMVTDLPEEYKTTEYYEAAIRACPAAIRYLPKKNRTVGISKAALSAMQYPSLTEAVTNEPDLLVYLHPSLYTHDACLVFVNTDLIHGYGSKPMESGFLHVTGKDSIQLEKLLQWKDVLEEAVKKEWRVLGALPQHMITPELCDIAVRADGRAYDGVPPSMITHELCETAVKGFTYNIDKIPDEYKTYELCMYCVQRSGYDLRSVPDELKTREMCITAIKSGYYNVKDIPEMVFDEEIAWLIVNGLSEYADDDFQRIPVYLRTPELCSAAVKKCGYCLRHVPDAYKTKDMCFDALQKTDGIIPCIPAEWFTKEMCLEAAKYGCRVCQQLPREHMTEDVWLKMIKHSTSLPNCIVQLIPAAYLNQELYDAIYKVAPYLIKEIPSDFITEEMVLDMTKRSVLTLEGILPDRYKTEEFERKMLEVAPPRTEWAVKLVIHGV